MLECGSVFPDLIDSVYRSLCEIVHTGHTCRLVLQIELGVSGEFHLG